MGLVYLVQHCLCHLFAKQGVPVELLSFTVFYVSCLHVQRNLKMELICLGLQ